MQAHELATDFFWEEDVVFVILAYHQRTNAFPVAQVGAFSEHGGNAAAQVGGGKARLGSVAVGGVGHVENPIDLCNAGIFDASGVKIIVWGEDRFNIAGKVDAIVRMGITKPADPIEPLGPVEHVELTLVVNHSWIKNIVCLPD